MDDNLVDELPWVMLGFRTSLLSKIKCCEFQRISFLVPRHTDLQPGNNLPCCRSLECSNPSSCYSTFPPRLLVAPNLHSAEFVLIRHDTHCGSLHPPYNRAFMFLQYGDKSLVVDTDVRPEIISIDKIKPAHVIVSRNLELAESPCSGHPQCLTPFTWLGSLLPCNCF